MNISMPEQYFYFERVEKSCLLLPLLILIPLNRIFVHFNSVVMIEYMINFKVSLLFLHETFKFILSHCRCPLPLCIYKQHSICSPFAHVLPLMAVKRSLSDGCRSPVNGGICTVLVCSAVLHPGSLDSHEQCCFGYTDIHFCCNSCWFAVRLLGFYRDHLALVLLILVYNLRVLCCISSIMYLLEKSGVRARILHMCDQECRHDV